MNTPFIIGRWYAHDTGWPNRSFGSVPWFCFKLPGRPHSPLYLMSFSPYQVMRAPKSVERWQCVPVQVNRIDKWPSRVDLIAAKQLLDRASDMITPEDK